MTIDGDTDAAVEAGWNKCRQAACDKDVSLLMRGKLYGSCVQSCMLRGSLATLSI